MRLPFLSLVHSVAPLQPGRVGGGVTAIWWASGANFQIQLIMKGMLAGQHNNLLREWD
jgi:hypothetical protein